MGIIIENFNNLNSDENIAKIREIVLKDRIDNLPLAYIQTFGCQQNFSDSEKLMGLMLKMGYQYTNDVNLADCIIFNTCAIRENAQNKVYGYIGELSHLKMKNPNLIVAIGGCMTQQEEVISKIKGSYPFVDLVFGTISYYDFPKIFLEHLTKHKSVYDKSEKQHDILEDFNVRREDNFKALVPIMYGCDNFCTYCIVPYVRGREQSRAPENIISEVKQLVSEGFKEITLLGQNVNSYSYGFPSLLREIDKIEGDFRIRFVSSHPKDASNDLIDTVINSNKICKHLHLPFQAGNNRILGLMNRKYTIEDYYKIVDYARSKYPDFSFSSDIIVGFPSETREELEDTKKALEYVKFDNLFTFVYSKRTGTKAAEFEDNISDDEKGRWLREIILFQREIAHKNLSRFIGKVCRVLVDDISTKNDGVILGKSDENIIVEFKGTSDLLGKFVDIKITDAFNWALFGEIVE